METKINIAGRWLLCAAFFTLYSSLFTLTSCSDDLVDIDVEDSKFLLRRSYSDDQIKLQRLGYAYNAAGNVMDDKSFSEKPVIDMERLMAAEAEYGPIVSTERRHYTSVDIFTGNTLQELGHQETRYTVNDETIAGCGMYYRNDSTFSKTTWHNSYRAHMFIKHIMSTRTIDAGIMRCLKLDDLNDATSVLEADFRQAVAKLVAFGEDSINETNAKEFSETYGTHVVISANLGGMIELKMEIERDSCVEKEYTTQHVCALVLGNESSKTSNSQLIKQISTNNVQYNGEICVKGGAKSDVDSLKRTFNHTDAQAKKISDGNYYDWAGRISIEPNSNYNATFVGGRYLPLYDMFENAVTRKVLRKVYETYMKKQAPTQEQYEPDYGVMPVAGNYGPDVRVAKEGTDNKACIMCQEYVPSIRSDKPCIVAYPLIRGKDGKDRPFFYSGLFVGDESHRPGRVIWQGSNSVYTPSDSIFAESDSASIRNLFDPQTHALKNVYFYWNAVHEQPCPTKREAPKNYSTVVHTVQPTALASPTSFAKVASTFWSVRPVVPKTGSLLEYWNTDDRFKQFREHRYGQNDGVLYKTGNYCYFLMDGGDNIVRAPQFDDDPDVNKRWIEAVSRAMKASQLQDYLPSVLQSQSITKMLGNRMNIFYNFNYPDHRNMLGLDWPTGYWVISDPLQEDLAKIPTQNDGQGIPIVTNDSGQARIMRLSGSGTDLLLDYPEYVKAFNYSDQMFFKFFPLFITIDNF